MPLREARMHRTSPGPDAILHLGPYRRPYYVHLAFPPAALPRHHPSGTTSPPPPSSWSPRSRAYSGSSGDHDNKLTRHLPELHAADGALSGGPRDRPRAGMGLRGRGARSFRHESTRRPEARVRRTGKGPTGVLYRTVGRRALASRAVVLSFPQNGEPRSGGRQILYVQWRTKRL
jgi:hypothetical protein